MAELMPMCSACFTASLLSCERPPAKRRKAVGLMKRKRAMVVSISSSLSGACRSSGVPGMGLRRLMGMDWYFQLAQCEGEFDALLHALAHADDAAAANVHACVAGCLQGAQLVFLRVRAAQLGEVGGGCLQVAVIAGDACVVQCPHFVFVEQSQ